MQAYVHTWMQTSRLTENKPGYSGYKNMSSSKLLLQPAQTRRRECNLCQTQQMEQVKALWRRDYTTPLATNHSSIAPWAR